MKTASFFAVILMGLCLIMGYPLTYWFGYYESFRFYEIKDCLSLIEYIMILSFLIIWMVALFKRKNRLWITMTLTLLLVLVWIKQKLPTTDYFLLKGMRDRMMEDCSLDKMRSFARDFDQLPTLPSGLPGKVYMNDDLLKSTLKGEYSFLNWLKLPGGFEGPSYVDENDGVVDVRWGGAISGHWGFSIAVNGGKINPQGSSRRILRSSDDIYFIVEND